MDSTLKQIVWICGGAAAGKETFIKRVAKGSEPDVCSRLGWLTLPTECKSSLEFIGRYPDDTDTTDKRDLIIDEVSHLITEADIVLIKEQRVDLRAKRPQRLQTLFPNARHIFIILECTDIDERMERYRKKPFASPDATFGALVDKFNTSLEMIAEIKDTEVYALDSSSGKHYRTIPNPIQLG